MLRPTAMGTCESGQFLKGRDRHCGSEDRESASDESRERDRKAKPIGGWPASLYPSDEKFVPHF